jgi:succinate dehydrogenase / fumarate reductase flavoprotein subunit
VKEKPLRNDTEYNYVGAWEYKGTNEEPNLVKEPLDFEYIEVKQRNYK